MPWTIRGILLATTFVGICISFVLLPADQAPYSRRTMVLVTIGMAATLALVGGGNGICSPPMTTARRRWFAFSLRTLFVLVTVVALAVFGFQQRRKRILAEERLENAREAALHFQSQYIAMRDKENFMIKRLYDYNMKTNRILRKLKDSGLLSEEDEANSDAEWVALRNESGDWTPCPPD